MREDPLDPEGADAAQEPLPIAPGKRWFEDYYNSTTAKFNERLVFVK